MHVIEKYSKLKGTCHPGESFTHPNATLKINCRPMFSEHHLYKLFIEHVLVKTCNQGEVYQDCFTFLIDEIGSITCGGVPMAIGVQADMATPALIRFGSEELKQQFLVPTIAGDFVACLGVSESGAGSDVASIKTVAVKKGGILKTSHVSTLLPHSQIPIFLQNYTNKISNNTCISTQIFENGSAQVTLP